MAKLCFTINLSFLYKHLRTEEDENPENLMSYEKFVEFIENADIYVVKTAGGDFLCFTGVVSDEKAHKKK